MGKNVSYPLKGDIVHDKKWIYLDGELTLDDIYGVGVKGVNSFIILKSQPIKLSKPPNDYLTSRIFGRM
jgi:hypothetical protein